MEKAVYQIGSKKTWSKRGLSEPNRAVRETEKHKQLIMINCETVTFKFKFIAATFKPKATESE